MLDDKMQAKLQGMVERHAELNERLCDPGLASRREEYLRITRENAELTELVRQWGHYRKAEQELADTEEMLKDPDPEIRELAQAELGGVKVELERLEQAIHVLLLPSDPNDAKNIILEIRAGTGGDEATLFAEDVFRMYARFAEGRGW